MSKFYNSKRTKNLYNPTSKKPFRISRSKLEMFMKCPRCFYLDRRLGIGQPGGFPFNLNNAVDNLLKNEFDGYRARGQSHPIMIEAGIDAIPFKHEKMDEWRDALRRGCSYLVPETNLFITGAVDDIWVTPDDELIIVDYKATSKDGEISLEADWQIGYKRQIEVYQWLFRRNDFKVQRVGYFLYCNGNANKRSFDGKLEFDIKLLPYEGDDSWVEQTILDVYQCLVSDDLPLADDDCDFCAYRESVQSEIS